jgi:hypothetical protein
MSKLIYAFTRRLLSLTVKNYVKRQKLKTKLILRLRKAGEFKKYISEYGIVCFTWKDVNGDALFDEYMYFIEKESTRSVIEIDIKRNNEYESWNIDVCKDK